MEEYRVRYKVVPTKIAIKQGKKLGVSDVTLYELIQEVKLLKFWPDNEGQFDYEKVGEAIEFKFNGVENKWIRVFVWQDDERKILWVVKVMAKKQNALKTHEKISLETAVSQIKEDLKFYKKNETKQLEIARLKVVDGGKNGKS